MKDHVAIVIIRGKEVLFVQRSKSKEILPLAWAFPSGTKEDYEDIFGTAKREAVEELGVEITPREIMCTKELPEFNDKLHFIICDLKDGDPQIREPQEIETLSWMTFDEFFNKFDDGAIGHGLIYLRQNPDLWKKYV